MRKRANLFNKVASTLRLRQNITHNGIYCDGSSNQEISASLLKRLRKKYIVGFLLGKVVQRTVNATRCVCFRHNRLTRHVGAAVVTFPRITLRPDLGFEPGHAGKHLKIQPVAVVACSCLDFRNIVVQRVVFDQDCLCCHCIAHVSRNEVACYQIERTLVNRVPRIPCR